MAQFDFYGRMAKADLSDTRQNGRYSVQRDAEGLIPDDVFQKLQLNSEDIFLDIGCGMGVNLIPAAKIADQAYGCDHPDILSKLREKDALNNIELIEGSFFDIEANEQFSKILIYSVLHTLSDEDDVYKFIDKALSLMSSDGALLLGDIPNSDRKSRFLNSEQGKEFQTAWERLCEEQPETQDISIFQKEENKDTVNFDDKFMFDIVRKYRGNGYHAYVLPQPPTLPFGQTREDILILGSEFQL